MDKRKLFPPLPDFAAKDPKALEWRVDRLETTVEDLSHQSSSGLARLSEFIWPAVMGGLGLLGLASPEQVANALKALGH